MTKRQQERLEKALSALIDAEFACGEWNRDDEDEPYEVVHDRAVRAETRLRKLIGLPARAEGSPA